MDGFDEVVKTCCEWPISGDPMYVLWKNLKRLQPVLSKFNGPLSNLHQDKKSAKVELQKAHWDLVNNRFDVGAIEKVKICIKEVIRINVLEEQILAQRAKVEWLRMGDGNNSYLYAIIKAKHSRNNMRGIQTVNGKVLHSHEEIEKEIMDFYGQLMGKEDNSVQHIDIKAMRKGPQLNMEQRGSLISNIFEHNILKSLNGI